jgi:hypothetical protein
MTTDMLNARRIYAKYLKDGNPVKTGPNGWCIHNNVPVSTLNTIIRFFEPNKKDHLERDELGRIISNGGSRDHAIKRRQTTIRPKDKYGRFIVKIFNYDETGGDINTTNHNMVSIVSATLNKSSFDISSVEELYNVLKSLIIDEYNIVDINTYVFQYMIKNCRTRHNDSPDKYYISTTGSIFYDKQGKLYLYNRLKKWDGQDHNNGYEKISDKLYIAKREKQL